MVRPKQLILPLDKERPNIVYFDQFLNVHPRCDLTQFERLDMDQYFPKRAPLCLEYCSGHGHWIVQQAQKYPDHNWIAVEMQMSRAKCIWAKIKNNHLQNCIVVCAEGLSFSSHLLPNTTIKQVYINFPDPWPKRRHHKNRIIQQPFLQELERTIIAGGTLTFVTDDESYSSYFQHAIVKHGRLMLLPEQEIPKDYGYSCFEDIFKKQGKTIRYQQVSMPYAG